MVKRVVMELVSPFSGLNHVLYLDNFFTSGLLVNELYKVYSGHLDKSMLLLLSPSNPIIKCILDQFNPLFLLFLFYHIHLVPTEIYVAAAVTI